MSNEKKLKESFVQMPYGVSYALSLAEERFVKHLLEIEFLRKAGYNVNFTRAQYMKRMAMREFTFDQCAKSLCRLGLINKSADSGRNRVHYRLNETAWHRLVEIVSMTRNVDKLTAFFDFHVLKLGKTIMKLTDEDTEALMQ